MKKPKILLYDIEVSPNISYTWQGKYEQTVIAFQKEWEVMSIAWKWLGKKKIYCRNRSHYNDLTDKSLLQDFKNVLDEADITVTQNGDAFDSKKLNTRMLIHKIPPPSPSKSVDTLKVARKRFKFNSNKLNDVAKTLDLTPKVDHDGFQLWLDCMAGKRDAWRKMTKYNKGDIVTLEEYYNRFLPWISNHPNVALYSDKLDVCPKCGSDKLESKGLTINNHSVFKRFVCNGCGGYCRVKVSEKNIKPKYSNV